jgi:DNA-binding PadR family transcriptional regulator
MFWKFPPWLVVVSSSAAGWLLSVVLCGRRNDRQSLYGGLIRLHILHHAAKEPIFGLGIIEELRRHGYELSAGTLYPILYGLEKKGYQTSRHERTGRRERRVYQITEPGRIALVEARQGQGVVRRVDRGPLSLWSPPLPNPGDDARLSQKWQ